MLGIRAQTQRGTAVRSIAEDGVSAAHTQQLARQTPSRRDADRCCITVAPTLVSPPARARTAQRLERSAPRSTRRSHIDIPKSTSGTMALRIAPRRAFRAHAANHVPRSSAPVRCESYSPARSRASNRVDLSRVYANLWRGCAHRARCRRALRTQAHACSTRGNLRRQERGQRQRRIGAYRAFVSTGCPRKGDNFRAVREQCADARGMGLLS